MDASASGWRRVTRQRPCPIGDHPDWCGVSADGRAAICARVQSDHPTRNGGWLHWLAPRGQSGGPARVAPPIAPARVPAPATVPVRPAAETLAPIERRDAAYRALVDELGLSTEHARHLTETRGLPLRVVLAAGFRTLPDLRSTDSPDVAAAVWPPPSGRRPGPRHSKKQRRQRDAAA